jgi:caveolin 1
MKEKASTTSEPEKDDSNPEKIEGEKTDEGDKKKTKKEKKKKEKKEKPEKPEKTASTSCHRRTQSCVQTFTVGLNVLDRDEKHINDTINLNFEDVLAEPESAHGFDPIWRLSFVLFTGSRRWIYQLLSALFALPLALVWGITFSLLSFFSVWFVTPILRILDVFLFYIRRVWVALIQTTLEPVTNAIGGCFSNVKVAHTNHTLQTV